MAEAFAATLELARCNNLGCNYVGHMTAAKDYGRKRIYHLVRRNTVDGSEEQASA